MTKPTPSANRTLIEVNAANINNIKEDVKDIKNRVTNHIPSKIAALDDKMDGLGVSVRKEISDLAIKLAALVGTVGLILKYFIK